MLSRRSLELRPDLPGLPQALITREDLIDCGLPSWPGSPPPSHQS